MFAEVATIYSDAHNTATQAAAVVQQLVERNRNIKRQAELKDRVNHSLAEWDETE